jgi:predicted nuclease with RNAse H fold
MDEAMLETQPIEAVDEAIEEPAPEAVTEETAVDAPLETIPEKAPVKEAPEASGTEDLLAEIARLKEELSQRDALAERLAREGEEFRVLYPNTNMQDLPDIIWEDVARGIPIAAAYALLERRRFTAEQKVLEYNCANARRSSGSLEPTTPDYYSPAEVRAMSQSEVRTNFDKIMRSMQKWH